MNLTEFIKAVSDLKITWSVTGDGAGLIRTRIGNWDFCPVEAVARNCFPDETAPGLVHCADLLELSDNDFGDIINAADGYFDDRNTSEHVKSLRKRMLALV